MSSSNARPPFVGVERTLLLGWYDLQRSLVRWKCDGLTHTDAYRSLLPASPLITVAGIVSHLRWAEQTWYEVLFLGGKDDGPQFSDDPEDAEMRVAGVSLAQLLDDYAAQCTR